MEPNFVGDSYCKSCVTGGKVTDSLNIEAIIDLGWYGEEVGVRVLFILLLIFEFDFVGDIEFHSWSLGW